MLFRIDTPEFGFDVEARTLGEALNKAVSPRYGFPLDTVEEGSSWSLTVIEGADGAMSGVAAMADPDGIPFTEISVVAKVAEHPLPRAVAPISPEPIPVRPKEPAED